MVEDVVLDVILRVRPRLEVYVHVVQEESVEVILDSDVVEWIIQERADGVKIKRDRLQLGESVDDVPSEVRVLPLELRADRVVTDEVLHRQQRFLFGHIFDDGTEWEIVGCDWNLLRFQFLQVLVEVLQEFAAIPMNLLALLVDDGDRDEADDGRLEEVRVGRRRAFQPEDDGEDVQLVRLGNLLDRLEDFLRILEVPLEDHFHESKVFLLAGIEVGDRREDVRFDLLHLVADLFRHPSVVEHRRDVGRVEERVKQVQDVIRNRVAVGSAEVLDLRVVDVPSASQHVHEEARSRSGVVNLLKPFGEHEAPTTDGFRHFIFIAQLTLVGIFKILVVAVLHLKSVHVLLVFIFNVGSWIRFDLNLFFFFFSIAFWWFFINVHLTLTFLIAHHQLIEIHVENAAFLFLHRLLLKSEVLEALAVHHPIAAHGASDLIPKLRPLVVLDAVEDLLDGRAQRFVLQPVEQRVNLLLLRGQIFLLFGGALVDIAEEFGEPLAGDEVVAQHDGEQRQHVIVEDAVGEVLDSVHAAIEVVVGGFLHLLAVLVRRFNDDLLDLPPDVLLAFLLLLDDLDLEGFAARDGLFVHFRCDGDVRDVLTVEDVKVRVVAQHRAVQFPGEDR